MPTKQFYLVVKIVKYYLLGLVVLISQDAFPQLLTNKGASVMATSGSIMQINGGVENSAGKIDNDGTLNIVGDITNADSLIGDGTINLSGNWINNATFIGGNSTINLNGANQNITGSVFTTFNNLSTTGSGVKTLLLNTTVAGVLSLTDRELATTSYTLLVTDPSPTAITRSSGFTSIPVDGFVSSTDSGKLLRVTNSTSTYLFPVGSSTGTARYRPIEITPAIASAHIFAVRFANVDATSESFDRNTKDTAICTINPDFYHRIQRTSGTNPADITFYYDDNDDNITELLAHWQNVPRWEDAGAISRVINASPTFSNVTKSAWNDFSQEAFAFATSALSLNSSKSDVTCNGANDGSGSVSVTGGSSPYTYSWSNGDTTSTIANLSGGNYTVTASDVNGCQQIATVSVNEPVAFSIVSGTTDATCNSSDGSASVTVTGGTTPYNYMWSNGATTQNIINLASGNYTVTVTDASTCQTTETLTVVEAGAPSTGVSIQNDVSCNGGSDGGATVTTSGGITPYTYGWTNGATTAFISNVSAGNYTVTVSDGNNCNVQTSVAINEPAPLTLFTIKTDLSCNGGGDGSASATAGGGTGGYTYTWSNGSSTQTISGIFAGTYTVTATDGNGCIILDSTTINQPIALTMTKDSRNVSCNGGSDGMVAVTPSGGTFPYTYSWSNGATDSSIVGLNAGNYIITISDNNSCQTIDIITIDEPVALGVIVTANDASCGNNDGSATASAYGGTTQYVYKWSNGTTTQLMDSVQGGNYVVTVTDANSCQQTEFVSINETGGPASGILSSTDANCFGSNDGSAIVTASGGVVPYTYSWSNGNTTANLTNVTAGTYTVTVFGADGCKSFSNAFIDEPSDLIIAVSGTDITCNGQDNGSASVNATGGISPYTYNWSNGQTSLNIFTLQPVTYAVTVFDANTCSKIDTVQIAEPLPLSISSITTDATCGLSDGNASVSAGGGTPGYLYAWSNGSNDSLITGLATGTYSITVRDANNCDAVDIVTINETGQPTVSITGSDVTCKGGNDGSATANPSGGALPYNYAWSNGDTDSMVTGLNAGFYVMTLTDNNGCVVKDSIVILEPTTSVIADAGVNDTICSGDSAFLTASGGVSYQWSPIGSTTTSVTVTPDSTTEYVLTAYDSVGCFDTDTVSVFVNPLPDIDAGPDIVICPGKGVQLNATGGISYTWIPSSGLNDTTIADPVASPQNTTTYTVIASDGNCINKDTLIITVDTSIVTANFTATAPNNIPLITVTFTNTSTGADSFLWDFGDGGTSTDENPVHTYNDDNVYTLTLIAFNSSGCADTLTIPGFLQNGVTFESLTGTIEIFLPSAFTPNNDGENDLLRVLGSGIKKINLKIYNEWGELIYISEDIFMGWDGYYKGQEAPEGNYVYILYAELEGDETVTKKGTVSLIR
ncbi:gliding motility-associated C-terminal domain-containing protein [Candidatus Amoebophilus asiaticus]|nr:gliding motility-associated C-terminal domain-containing protein [Candidatus Amoebophilus asiaticus]